MKRYSIIFILLMCVTFNVNALCTTTEDMKNEIDNIFQNRISNSYEIEYSNEVNIDEVNKYFKSKYMLESSNTNIYTYEDFINYDKLRDYPVIQDNKYIFVVKFNIANENQYNKIIEFGNALNNKYKDLSDDEKIYIVINYIKNNITKTDSRSLYDGIYNFNIKESSLLVQYMLSNLNVESYITERLSTGKKYNLVKLNNKWYILDIDNDYILVGYTSGDFRPDTYSNNILVSKYEYTLGNYDIDYSAIKSLIKRNNKTDKKEQVTDDSKKDFKIVIEDYNTLLEWLLLIGSICVIILVVRHYTR